MPKTREAIQAACEEKAEKLRKKARAMGDRAKKLMVGVPPTLPIGAEVVITDWDRLRIVTPNNPAIMNQVRDRFRQFGWEVGEFKVAAYGGSQTASMRLPNLKQPDNSWLSRQTADILAFDSKEGSTCRTVRIGTKFEEVSVYETRCEEGEDF